MKVIDPGHEYLLDMLDLNGAQACQRIIFVKREGEMYPGNIGYHPGTNLQEVLRACHNRLGYLNGQIPSACTNLASSKICEAIYWLEARAAKRHQRPIPLMSMAVYGDTCPKCLHTGCRGECHG